jgi:hypothetical protein
LSEKEKIIYKTLPVLLETKVELNTRRIKKSDGTIETWDEFIRRIAGMDEGRRIAHG